MKAIILVGGLGERLRPLTDNMPKPLLPINGKPIIEHIIENLKKHKIKEIILAVSHHADKIKKYFGNGSRLGVKIKYSVEEIPLGTGGAIKTAAKDLGQTFIAINGDNLADFNWTDIINQHKNNNAQITLALSPREDVENWGIARLDGKKIIEFIEKPTREEAPSNLNNAGGYVFEPEALEILPEGKSSIERDCFEIQTKKGVVFAYNHPGQWFPTDNLEKYELAKKYKK